MKRHNAFYRFTGQLILFTTKPKSMLAHLDFNWRTCFFLSTPIINRSKPVLAIQLPIPVRYYNNCNGDVVNFVYRSRSRLRYAKVLFLDNTSVVDTFPDLGKT